MKFKNDEDREIFEITGLDESLIRKKLTLKDRYNSLKNKYLKDRKAQRTMKLNWNRNKAKLLKGIHKWHKSTQGKRFHRALGRFNALRETKQAVNGKIELSIDETSLALLTLSNIETHLLIELNYYEPDFEALIEFIDLVDMYISSATELKMVLLDTLKSGEIEVNDFLSIIDITQLFLDDDIYIKEKRTLLGLNNDKNIDESILKVYEAKENLNKYDFNDLNDYYNVLDEIIEIYQ